ncbi:MAG: hypothetical protein CMD22_00615 [Flavobacteriales bacterium]|nr:hypothetical protein [Flavobacteriales bacterium]|tara:strand:+ start:1210 stop:2055 length:846 start_codon:yes stop_codon:yes gene_type:complete
MISLILSIVFTVVLFLCFKEFEKKGVNTHQAITINYITASLLAYFIYNKDISIEELISSTWIYPTISLGIFFVIMFNIMATTTQKLGVSIAAMSSKMSLIIPVLLSYFFYPEVKISALQFSGIILALVAVYCTFKKQQTSVHSLNIAILLFIGAGTLDASIDYIETIFLNQQDDEYNKFIITIFSVAFITGLVKMIFDKSQIKLKSVFSGMILGVPNYFSIYFILKSLEELGGIIVFPVLNIGVVLLSSIISYVYYKEEMSLLNWSGISLSCISIILILSV